MALIHVYFGNLVTVESILPDEDDLVLWTEAEVAASAEPAELLNLEDLRVSRPPFAAVADAPVLLPATPPEAPLPPTRLPGVLPVLRLLLLPQESW